MNQHPAPPIAPLRDPDNEPTVPQFPAPGWHAVREELRAICAEACAKPPATGRAPFRAERES